MKTSTPVGISGYGAYIPRFRLPSSEVSRIWHGGGSGPNKEKAVASYDEDSATMAVEVARRALESSGVSTVGAIFVGTESKPYAVKPTSTIVAQALGQNKTLAADFEFACKAGTEAIQAISGLVGSRMVENGLAIAVDTAQGRPGDELEFTAASGAAAFVISSSDLIAEIEGSTSYVSDTPDFWRRQGEKYPRHLSRFTGEPAYFRHLDTSVKMLFKDLNLTAKDFTYAIFHQPNPRFPVEIAQRLGFSQKQFETGMLNYLIGNTYSASSPLGLAAVLDEAQPGDRILLASFGSGAGSDAFSIVVKDAITSKRSSNNHTVRKMIEDCTRLDYALYAKYRNKIVV